MRVRGAIAILVCVLLGGLAIEASEAGAYRERLKHPWLGKREEWLAPPGGEPEKLEGACGLTVSPSTSLLYVGDYYHRSVGVYTSSGLGAGGFSLPGGTPLLEINTLNAVCGLAVDSAENVYANELHQAVLRLSPNEEVIAPGDATGIAVEDSGDLYVNYRTYVAVYEAPVVPGELPVEKIGLGSMDDAYGLTVDFDSGTVYVADAADDKVKGFVPAVSLTVPQVTIEHEFRSLVDAGIAVDATNGHVLVLDNRKPGFEDPEAAIFEFSASGEFLDRLSSRVIGPPDRPKLGPVFGEPSGIAVDPSNGELYVTTGNSEEANVVKYGAFEASAPPAPPGESLAPGPGGSTTTHSAASGVTAPGQPALPNPSRHSPRRSSKKGRCASASKASSHRKRCRARSGSRSKRGSRNRA